MIYNIRVAAEPPYKVTFYRALGGACPVEESIALMPAKHEAKAMKFLQLLEEKGPDLPRPYADVVHGKIRELVIDIQHHGYRLLYFFAGKTIVVTHVFLKKTRRTPPAEIHRAERCMNDWMMRNEI